VEPNFLSKWLCRKLESDEYAKILSMFICKEILTDLQAKIAFKECVIFLSCNHDFYVPLINSCQRFIFNIHIFPLMLLKFPPIIIFVLKICISIHFKCVKEREMVRKSVTKMEKNVFYMDYGAIFH
jgi:hypothetical protein